MGHNDRETVSSPRSRRPVSGKPAFKRFIGRQGIEQARHKAHALAGLGIYVLPCHWSAFGKVPTIPGDGGFKHGSVDHVEIDRMWDEHPGELVGYYVGKSGLLVLDADFRELEHPAPGQWPYMKDGMGTLALWELTWDDRAINYGTGHGGRHFVFRAPEGAVLPPSTEHDGLEGVDRLSGDKLAIWYGEVPPAEEWAALPYPPDWLLTTTITTHSDRNFTSFSGDLPMWEEWLGDDDPSPMVENLIEKIRATPHVGNKEIFHLMSEVHEARDLYGQPGVRHALRVLWRQYNATTNNPEQVEAEWDRTVRRVIGDDWTPVPVEPLYLLEPRSTEPPVVPPAAVEPEIYVETGDRPEPPKRGLNLITLDEIRKLPPVHWWVDNLFMQDSQAMINGQGGIGKTAIMLHVSACIATGTPFFDAATKQGKVLYLAAEGLRRFDSRLDAACDMHGFDSKAVNANISFLRDGFELTDPSDVRKARETLEDHGHDLIVLDTFSQLGGVKDENSASEVSSALRVARDLQRVNPLASFVVVHHTPEANPKKARGSNAFRNNTDTTVTASKLEEPEDAFQLSTRADDGGKQKDGDPAVFGPFQLVKHLGSMVVVPARGLTAADAANDGVYQPVRTALSGGEVLTMTELVERTGISRRTLGPKLRDYAKEGWVGITKEGNKAFYTMTRRWN